ncbi:MAG: cupin domain-containing protein [Candidatus Doudnabacteria bacterium]|nr:cupin domain-containing protein [Candidatus Doudnabacteria bacterium]
MLTIDIQDKIKEINSRPWFPVEVARVNDQIVRLALMEGEYHWHEHKNEDELFYVVKGTLTIQIKDSANIKLTAGQIAVVPKGIQHCPKAEKGTYVLMFEPLKLESKGS